MLRTTARLRARPRTASALLAFALAGCAVPDKTPTTSKAVAVPASASDSQTLPVSAAPSPTVAEASVARLPAPPQEPVVIIAPLDGGEPPAMRDTAPVVQVPVTSSPGKPLAQGMASWYGPRFHGRRTASGERYNMHALTAAHKTLPFGTKLRVRSVHTGKEVVVRVNDRGPYKHQRIIDLSHAAMVALGTLERGVTEVELLRE